MPTVGMASTEGTLMGSANGIGASGVGGGGELQNGGQEMAVQELGSQGIANEFNITNFMVDANSDWLFSHSGG